MEAKKIEHRIQVPVAVFRRKEYWIAYSPALKVFGYSKDNADSALNDFDVAIKTFVFVQSKLNTLDEALLNLGWSRTDGSINQPLYFNVNMNDLRGVNFEKRSREVAIPA